MAPKTDTLPTQKELLNPTLFAINSLGGSGLNNEITDQVIQDMQIPLDLASQPHVNGRMTKLEYGLAWARTVLKWKGVIDNSEGGVWSLTDKGRTSLRVDEEEVFAEYLDAKKKQRGRQQPNGFDPRDGDDDAVEGAELWRTELISVLRDMDPGGFERLCQLLLRESGFIKVNVTGRSGDGGIDGHGIIRLEGMISFPVMFQCKRYSNSVPAREIRDFRGAMQGRSEKGLFFTTSDFTSDARKEAIRSGAPIIDLVDGMRLTDLLMQFELGVKPTRQMVEAEVDKSYFHSI